MIKTFLKAKHWQLFILTFGIPMIVQFSLMASIFSNFANDGSGNPEIIFSYFKIFPIIMIIFMGVFFGWFWSIGAGLSRIIPAEYQLNVTRFKILLIIPVVYLVFFSVFISSMMETIMMGLNPAIFQLFMFVHLLAMFCIFYCLHFVAKTIKTALLQQEVTFGDFIEEFFLIWFYPIGIWIIQPKINKLVEEHEGIF